MTAVIGRCVCCGTSTVPRRTFADAAGVGVRKHVARGLCNVCYDRCRHRGTLADYERGTRSAAEMLEEVGRLLGEGHTREQAAERLGVTRDAVDMALRRARRSDAE